MNIKTVRAFERHFSNGVAVLTCGAGPTVHGVTVSTLALASIEPPMVSFALRTGSRGLTALLSTTSFVVNQLSERQGHLARHFASRTRGFGIGQQDESVWPDRTAHGVPLLADAAGWLECMVDRSVPTGDHMLVLARVLRAERTSRTDLRS